MTASRALRHRVYDVVRDHPDGITAREVGEIIGINPEDDCLLRGALTSLHYRGMIRVVRKANNVRTWGPVS